MHPRLSVCFAAAVLSAAAVSLAGVSPATAQGPPQPVAWSVAVEPASGRAAAGGTVMALVTARIDEGWHVYAPDETNDGPRPVQITVVKNSLFSAAGELDAPEPEREMDQAFGQVTASYTGKATFRLPVSVAAEAAAGQRTFELSIAFQACDGRICLPSRVTRVTASVTITR